MSFKGKAYYLLGLFSFTILFVYAQDQKLADSLINQYNSGSYLDDEVVILKKIANNETHPERKLEYSELLIQKASSDSLFDFLHSGYLQKGNALKVSGYYDLAFESYLISIKFADRINNEVGIGAVNIAIADTYSAKKDFENAYKYYNIGIQLLRQTDDSVSLAIALTNAGDEYVKNKKYDLAFQYFEEAEIIFKNTENKNGIAYILGNMGDIYAEQGNYDLAKANIDEAITILEEMEDYYGISDYLLNLSDISLKESDWSTALSHAQRSLKLAESYGLKEQIRDANFKLSVLFEQSENYKESEKYYKNYIAYRDSLTNIESVEKMANLRADYEVSQKQIELDLSNQKNENQKITVVATVIALLLIGILAFVLYRRNHFIKKTNIIINEEKSRSQNLLLNILPKETALELIRSGKVLAKKFESITVLFTDFKWFTHYAENLSPEALVESVDYYFSKFDEIMEKYNLEKIKTIGDSYMCAGGLHYHQEDHALKMVQAALEIVEFVKDAKKLSSKNEAHFDIRIGINTGPVVAGVVGTKKFAYDIWGDTVNIASRMESNSKSGKINISEKTYKLIKDAFDCEYRGEIEVKNRGMMNMYFVKGIKNKEQSKQPEETNIVV